MKRFLTICTLALSAVACAAPAGTEDAQAATRDGRWSDAYMLWQAAARQFPDDAGVTAEMGWAEMETGRPADARRDFNRALRLSPGLLRAQTGLVALALREMRPDDALALAQAAVHAHPEEAAAYLALGNAQRAGAHRSEAETAFRRAAALDPASAQAHASLADVLLMRNKADEAIKEYRSAVRLQPSLAYREGLGRAAMVGGLYGEAATNFATALDLARSPKPDWTRLDALALLVIDAVGRAAQGVRSGTVPREDYAAANQTILSVADSLADDPQVKDADPGASPAMAQRALACTLLGQAAASDLAAIRKGPDPAADAVVFREQARRAFVAAQAASAAVR